MRLAAGLAEPRPAAAQRPVSYEEELLEVDVNRQGINRSTVVLRRSDGMFLISLEDLKAFRLRTPSTAPYMNGTVPFFPVDALGDTHAEMDEARQRLTLMAPPEAFEHTIDAISSGIVYPKPVPPAYGGFLNYDLNVGRGSGQTTASELTEAGFFTPYRVLLNSAITTAGGGQARTVRLESTFQTDFPSRHASLRLGDSISRPGTWGNSLRFGGAQYGTNFTTEPGFRAFPTPPVAGTAIVPSLVDVFINNTLVATRRVDPGPFTITNIPFTSGGGDVRLVVRDIANRQQLLTLSSPFYSTNTLLQAGLADYSIEAGSVREGFGVTSFDYGSAFTMGTYRYGLTEKLTGEVHAEATRTREAIGTSLTAIQPRLGQFDGTLAASRSEEGGGALAIVGLQHQIAPVSIGGQVQWNSRDFHRILEPPDLGRLRLQWSVGGGLQVSPRLGSLSAGYVSRTFYDKAPQRVATLGYILPISTWATLSVSASRLTGEQEGSNVGIAVTIPLGTNLSATAQSDNSRSETGRTRDFTASLQRTRAGDSPYSYRLLARSNDVEGVLDYRADRFEVEGGLARSSGGELAERLEVSGGLGYAGGYVFASRRISGSFGVVKVADYPGVAVLFDNQYAGRTNDRGYFVIPEMRAYDRNSISIRDTDLPMDAVIETLKLDASPYFRSGVVIEFPIRRLRAGVIHVMLDDGKPMPAGAVARLEGQAEEFPVANGGELYLNGFGERNRIVATWKEQTCVMDVPYPRTNDPLPDLGDQICRGVRP